MAYKVSQFTVGQLTVSQLTVGQFTVSQFTVSQFTVGQSGGWSKHCRSVYTAPYFQSPTFWSMKNEDIC